MDVKVREKGEAAFVDLIGSFDASSAHEVEAELLRILHKGVHDISLRMNEVEYMSSAGIRVVVKIRKQISAAGGSFKITAASDFVRNILEQVGMGIVFDFQSDAGSGSEHVEEEVIKCEIINPDGRFSNQCFKADKDSSGFQSVELGKDTLCFGVGSFSGEGASGQSRFGEVAACCGCAAYLPTQGKRVVDYSVSEAAFVPSVDMFSGSVLKGSFSHLLRFETRDEAAYEISEILEEGLKCTGSESIAFAFLGEVDGLCGAYLKKSPALAKDLDSIFTFPQIRDWMGFTPEKAYRDHTALCVGIASREKGAFMGMSPFGVDEKVYSHHHSICFSYQPIRKKELDLQKSVRSLFDDQKILTVLHSINDRRPIAGAGESSFVRGALWCASAEEVVS